MYTSIMEEVMQGNIKSLSRFLSLIENENNDYYKLLKTLPYSDKKIIGITGPPGAGKSTLVDCLISELINGNKKIGVVCVDPSSPFTKGAFLGDRIRMSAWFNSPNVFIRSLASRGNTTGLHPKIIEITDVMKAAPFDHIIVETVGAGQTETEIAALADTTVVVFVPEAGDEIQNMKSGLIETADIFVVNKADRPDADRFVKNLRSMLALSSNQKQRDALVIKTVATEKTGIQELVQQIIQHQKNAVSNIIKAKLLAEKAYLLVQQKRMKDINMQTLAQQIGQLIDNNNFNLYAFVEELSD